MMTQLLEQLNVACKWLLENKVEVPNRGTFVSLLNKAEALLKEIYSPLNLQHRFRTPTDDTEPVSHLFFELNVSITGMHAWAVYAVYEVTHPCFEQPKDT